MTVPPRESGYVYFKVLLPVRLYKNAEVQISSKFPVHSNVSCGQRVISCLRLISLCVSQVC
jgi:hypothetical protein